MFEYSMLAMLAWRGWTLILSAGKSIIARRIMGCLQHYNVESLSLALQPNGSILVSFKGSVYGSRRGNLTEMIVWLPEIVRFYNIGRVLSGETTNISNGVEFNYTILLYANVSKNYLGNESLIALFPGPHGEVKGVILDKLIVNAKSSDSGSTVSIEAYYTGNTTRLYAEARNNIGKTSSIQARLLGLSEKPLFTLGSRELEIVWTSILFDENMSVVFPTYYGVTVKSDGSGYLVLPRLYYKGGSTANHIESILSLIVGGKENIRVEKAKPSKPIVELPPDAAKMYSKYAGITSALEYAAIIAVAAAVAVILVVAAVLANRRQ